MYYLYTRQKEGEIMIDDFNEMFARNLKKYMSAYGMTQRALADKLKVNASSVSYWTRGVKVPRMDKIDKMCEIFECKRSDLIKDNVESDNTSDILLNRHIKAFAQLSDNQQKLVEELIETLRIEPENTDKIVTMIQNVLSFFGS